MHWDAEGEDLVMRAKILHTVGETHLAIDSIQESRHHQNCALEAFEEAHGLFEETEGKIQSTYRWGGRGVRASLMSVATLRGGEKVPLRCIESTEFKAKWVG